MRKGSKVEADVAMCPLLSYALHNYLSTATLLIAKHLSCPFRNYFFNPDYTDAAPPPPGRDQSSTNSQFSNLLDVGGGDGKGFDLELNLT